MTLACGLAWTAVLVVCTTSAAKDSPDKLVQLAEECLKAAAAAKTQDAVDLQRTKAEQLLRQALKDAPHYAAARGMLGDLLLANARESVRRIDRAQDERIRKELREHAGQLIAEAREFWQQAHDAYRTAYDTYPKFIDPKESPAEYEARMQSEIDYLNSQLRLGTCGLAEAERLEPGSNEFKEALTAAALQFEQTHQRYRSMVGGLHARLWQARCFELGGDLRKTLGICNEFLSHPGVSPAMQLVKDRARSMRLRCLNHPERRDYRLVINEATAWFEAAGERSDSEIGRAIRWELARAQELLALDGDVDKSQHVELLKKALENARLVRGEHSEDAAEMRRRIESNLSRE